MMINESPRWLEYSGLPQKLNELAGICTWSIFKKLIELDCAANLEPDLFFETIERISQATGLDSKLVRETLVKLRELNYIECYLPESDHELAYFRIKVPIDTPKSPLEIPYADGGLYQAPGEVGISSLRYFSTGTTEAEPSSRDSKKFDKILHWYFDLCGAKMNSFILEQLIELEKLFDLERIKKAFEKAKKNNCRSLSFVLSELYRRKGKIKK